MIGVDWSLGSTTLNYVSIIYLNQDYILLISYLPKLQITARNRVGEVASVLARFADNLHQIGYLRFEEMHAIGHSLGCVFLKKL